MNGFFGLFNAPPSLCSAQDVFSLSLGHHALQAADCAKDTAAAALCFGHMRNAAALRTVLNTHHILCDETASPAELLLGAYHLWDEAFIDHVEGALICAVIDCRRQKLLLCADRMGEASPLFYCARRGTVAFASHPEKLLSLPFVSRKVDTHGLRELFALFPARTPSSTPLRDIRTLSPGCMLIADPTGARVRRYFRLECRPHEDDEKTTVDTVRHLTEQAVRDTLSLHPAAMLSGGLDSTVLTALLSKLSGETVRTFSLDYEDNAQHFLSGSYQPERDTPYVEHAVQHLGTDHTHVILSISSLADALEDAMLARGFPGMADIDSSLLLFARHISAPCVLSGECGDEVFGGYPWFNREDLIEADCFPWSGSISLRNRILRSELQHELRLHEYAADCWRSALDRRSVLPDESPRDARLRRLQGICFEYFMSNLQERAAMLCASAGLSVCTPFCDERLVQYVYNVPWEMKRIGGQEKGLLRRATADLLPAVLLTRKKSPFPKTHHPQYAALVCERLRDVLSDPNAPILTLINRRQIEQLMQGDLSPAATPWFGQLMGGAQMIAYLLQLNQWLVHYRIEL